MCIPCVMCGACADADNAVGLEEGLCPECGASVPDEAISCPACYTFLYRSAHANASEREPSSR